MSLREREEIQTLPREVTMAVLTQTDFEQMTLHRRGKVRDVYDLGHSLLIVVTDRISAFDVIMKDAIPHKGEVLNQISAFWFEKMTDIVPNHVLSTDPQNYPDVCRPHTAILRKRSMLVQKAEALPVECIVRGYLSGSAWNDYKRNGSVAGIKLRPGLQESEQLPEPIFTPSTKAESGHDQTIPFSEMANRIGNELSQRIRDTCLSIYRQAQKIAEEKGIIISDTKMEFGLRDGELLLIDELLTPDSSRFWPMTQYRPGGPQVSYDKQFLRDYLISINWDNNTPPPPLPQEIIQQTSSKYIEALKLFTDISV